ncbi:hypothetical protein [Mesoplasma lactucae]|nr:hypothetical protein [Mesoplasma lactucae]
MDKVLLHFALKYDGEWEKIYDALDRKEKISAKDLETVETKINCKYMTILNPLYPNNLKNCHRPPFVIFYQGKIDLLINYYSIFTYLYEEGLEPTTISDFEKMTKSFVKADKTFLLGNLNLMSNFINKTIKQQTDNWIELKDAIKDCPDTETTLYISEAYEKNANDKWFINRVLPGLATATIVLEANRGSEVDDVIKYGINENKEIFVLPLATNIKKKVNNFLIKQGAKLIEKPSDVLNEF